MSNIVINHDISKNTQGKTTVKSLLGAIVCRSFCLVRIISKLIESNFEVRSDSNDSTIFEFWNPYSRDPIIKCDGDVTKWHRKEDVISFVIRGGHTCSIS